MKYLRRCMGVESVRTMCEECKRLPHDPKEEAEAFFDRIGMLGMLFMKKGSMKCKEFLPKTKELS